LKKLEIINKKIIQFFYKPKFILMMLLYPGMIFSQNEYLSIRVNPEKYIFTVGELIPINFTIVNKRKDPVSIEYNCALEDDLTLYLTIIDSKSITFKRIDHFAYDCFGGWKTFKFFKVYKSPTVLLLQGLYNLNNKDSLPAGEYNIFLKDDNRKIFSDTTTFKVVEQNDSLYSKFINVIGIENSMDKFKALRKLLYSNCIYSDIVMNELLSLHRIYINNFKKLEKDILFYLGFNLNSISADKNLIKCSREYKKIKGKHKMFNFLKMICSKFPNTRVSMLSKKIIDGEEFPEFLF